MPRTDSPPGSWTHPTGLGYIVPKLLTCSFLSRLVSRVSRDEIELMAEEIEATEASHNTAQLLASQALLAIR